MSARPSGVRIWRWQTGFPGLTANEQSGMAQGRDIGESPGRVSSFGFPVSRRESGAERGETALISFLLLVVVTLLCHRCVRDRRNFSWSSSCSCSDQDDIVSNTITSTMTREWVPVGGITGDHPGDVSPASSDLMKRGANHLPRSAHVAEREAACRQNR